MEIHKFIVDDMNNKEAGKYTGYNLLASKIVNLNFHNAKTKLF